MSEAGSNDAQGTSRVEAVAARPVEGIALASYAAGIRYSNRDDLVLLTIPEQASVSALFTQNHFRAAPVSLAREHLRSGPPRALLINSGNANAGTGKRGLQDARQSCEWVAAALNIESEQVLPFSTGVIGEALPMKRMQAGIQELPARLAESNWLSAAKAIMTTDTVEKLASTSFQVDGRQATLTGMAKGSGMICPNMATMLAFIATDAHLEPALLDDFLRRACDASFNRISVDGDTSTNDAVVLIASGQGELFLDDPESQAAHSFYHELEQLFIELATAIVRDGEGATRFVTVKVDGAASETDAREVAYSVANSPLVKTAVNAGDPNWGRILAAVGKAPLQQLDIGSVDINIDGQALIEQGSPAESYSEAIGQRIFSQPELEISINLGSGDHAWHVWTTDLSEEYVRINADYRS